MIPVIEKESGIASMGLAKIHRLRGFRMKVQYLACLAVLTAFGCGDDQATDGGVRDATADEGMVTIPDARIDARTDVSVDMGTDAHSTDANPDATDANPDATDAPDMRVDGAPCAEDEYVTGHRCVTCPSGSGRAAGDDPSGEDTLCEDACSRALGVTCDIFEQAYIKASNTGDHDRFGLSIALDGDTLAVGAPAEDSGAMGVGGDETDDSVPKSGAVYVFRRTAEIWSQEAYLKASNTGERDFFGLSLALDGNTLAVGTPSEDSAATGIDGDQTDNSAPGSGAVYIFSRRGDNWNQTAYVKASNTDEDDRFGTSVALYGDTLAVGAPREASGATGVDGDETDNSMGHSGAVYIFGRIGEEWSQTAYLKASNTGRSDQFGFPVVLSGNTLAVGARREPSAATGVDGDQNDNSAWYSGAVYIFSRAEGVWTQEAYLKASNTDERDRFGRSLALDGDTLAVGAFFEESAATGVDGDQTDNSAPFCGAVYVFRRTDGTWAQEAYLKASNARAHDEFGNALALDGNTLVIAAAVEDSDATGVNGDQGDSELTPNSGAVYIFRRTDETWAQIAYVKASNTGFSDTFGASLAIDGDTLAIGAPEEDSAATGVGGDQTDNSGFLSGAAYLRRLAP